MAYLGSKPQSGFISNAKERYTGITTAYVDLNHSIASLADVIVWVNYVKQDATNLTLTSSTRITLGATLVSTDIVEIAYLGKAVATQNPSTNSVTNDMLAGSIANDKLAGSIANSKLANSSITLNGSAVSLGGSATVGGENAPYFFASVTSNQTVTHDTTTKCSFDRADVDSASGYDTTNKRYTIPSGKGGYWHIGYTVSMYASGEYIKSCYVYSKKNGSDFPSFNSRHQGVQAVRHDSYPSRDIGMTKSFIANLSASDYIEIHVNYGDSRGSGNTAGVGEYYSSFWGYRLVQ